jgi:hypothetical protein
MFCPTLEIFTNLFDPPPPKIFLRPLTLPPRFLAGLMYVNGFGEQRSVPIDCQKNLQFLTLAYLHSSVITNLGAVFISGKLLAELTLCRVMSSSHGLVVKADGS